MRLRVVRVELAEIVHGDCRAARGIWRLPPSFDGSVRAPVPRFTALSVAERRRAREFFTEFAGRLARVLLPGAHAAISTNPTISDLLTNPLADAGLERRGTIVRLVRTLRGGDRPKGAESEFPEISAIPRSAFEPWVLFRRPFEGTLAENLRRYGVGGLRRPNPESPFVVDVVPSGRTPKREREIAAHPSLKPQAFLRTLVRATLPLGRGVVVDPFSGSGSTLAAASAVGYRSLGIEIDREFFVDSLEAVPRLAALEVGS